MIWKLIFTKEKGLFFNLFTLIFVLTFYHSIFVKPYHPLFLLFAFIWLILAIFAAAFAVARHAGSLAVYLREPFGSLVLTLSVIAIEVVIITSVMLTGGESPVLARDTMFSVIMIVLNGLLGFTLLIGGLRYREQQINLQGANAFLSVILLITVVGLILPNYTDSTNDATLSPFLTIFLIILSLSTYAIFLGIQTVRHRKYFVEVAQEAHDSRHGEAHYSLMIHVVFLLAYLITTFFLAKIVAVPIDYGTRYLHLPDALTGMLVAILVLAPEAMAAFRAGLYNLLQHSVNVLLGSVLATIGLTIPAVLIVSMVTGKMLILGINTVDTVLLFMTFLMSILTFGSERTNVLQGVVHLLIFLVYVALIFD